MEKYKEMMGHKEKEVIEMRQQLAKLSRIIDKQKEELKSVESELRLVIFFMMLMLVVMIMSQGYIFFWFLVLRPF